MPKTLSPVCGNLFGHHWSITNVVIGHASYYHYDCLRCGAQKDQPTEYVKGKGGGWKAKYRDAAHQAAEVADGR